MRDEADLGPDGGGNGTWTREQLLQHRGYPPELAAGNGHATQPVALVEPPARVCPGCGGEVTGSPQRKWCSPRCKRKHFDDGRRTTTSPQRAARTLGRNHPTPPVPKPPEAVQGAGNGWADVLAALESAGAQVQFLSVNFGGSRFEITRW